MIRGIIPFGLWNHPFWFWEASVLKWRFSPWGVVSETKKDDSRNHPFWFVEQAVLDQEG